MVGIMRHSLQARLKACCVLANSLCINVLNILRQNGFIYSFTFDYRVPTRNTKLFKGYPRVIITFKYTDSSIPVIKELRTFKNTKSNIYTARRKYLSVHHSMKSTEIRIRMCSLFPNDLSGIKKREKYI